MVIGEGKTEREYIKSLGRKLWPNTVAFTVPDSKSDILHLIETAERKQLGRQWDAVWIVADADNLTPVLQQRLESWAAQNGGDLNHFALSNPCIEIWFLNLLGIRPKMSQAQQVIETLEKSLKKYGHQYKKGEILEEFTELSEQVTLREVRRLSDSGEEGEVSSRRGCPTVGASAIPLFIAAMYSLHHQRM